MRRSNYLLILMACTLFTMAVGCSGSPSADPSRSQPVSDTTDAVGTTAFADEGTAETVDRPASEGRIRLPYTGNNSSVVYVTSASDLPDYEELEAFDDAYFQDHALILVTETVRSGSIDVGILSVDMDDSTATVTLYHRMPSNASGTTDMATWLLWMEVDPGLDCQWAIANPAVKSDRVSS